MFKGFNIQYPEYEIITPQTNLTYNIRSLNVQEEEKLKGSLLSTSNINEHLNKCIYNLLTKKPDHIKSYDDFLRNTTLKDRDALLYGLYHITYEDIRNYDIICSSCQKTYPITIKASSTFNINYYPGDNILTSQIKVPLDLTRGVIVTLKQPTIFDETVILKQSNSIISSNLDILIETLIIDQFEQKIENNESIIYNDREDVIDAYKSLPAKDKRKIFSEYKDHYGKYGILLQMLSRCIHCKEEELINIDLVENFFRVLHSI
jgi:hypothetical protein